MHFILAFIFLISLMNIIFVELQFCYKVFFLGCIRKHFFKQPMFTEFLKLINYPSYLRMKC
jgi:hypothetical protein